MQARFFRTLWGAGDDYAAIATEARAAGFSGLEGPLPETAGGIAVLGHALAAEGLRFIGEICTGGASSAYWVPRRDADVTEHLRSLTAELARYDTCPFDVEFINCMGGLDAWPLTDALSFFAGAMTTAARWQRTISFETHRTRCFYAPWATLPVLRELPELLVTCDFSHWCVVAERLIDTEEEALAAAVTQAHHIQCRVGYPQGPQVPHPAAPEYADCLSAHQRWWKRIWVSQRARGYAVTTMTPEFGADDYLHRLPFTQAPVADLWQIARWMADTERARYALYSAEVEEQR